MGFIRVILLLFTRKSVDFSCGYWYNTCRYGDVPKWLKGADSKSARRRKACGGSNPSISAIVSVHFRYQL